MFCPICGKENPEGSTFCAGCGKPLSAPTAPAPAPAAAPVAPQQPAPQQYAAPQQQYAAPQQQYAAPAAAAPAKKSAILPFGDFFKSLFTAALKPVTGASDEAKKYDLIGNSLILSGIVVGILTIANFLLYMLRTTIYQNWPRNFGDAFVSSQKFLWFTLRLCSHDIRLRSNHAPYRLDHQGEVVFLKASCYLQHGSIPL